MQQWTSRQAVFLYHKHAQQISTNLTLFFDAVSVNTLMQFVFLKHLSICKMIHQTFKEDLYSIVISFQFVHVKA